MIQPVCGDELLQVLRKKLKNEDGTEKSGLSESARKAVDKVAGVKRRQLKASFYAASCRMKVVTNPFGAFHGGNPNHPDSRLIGVSTQFPPEKR